MTLAGGAQRRHHVHVRLPLAVGLERQGKGQAALVDGCRLRRRDPRLTYERTPFVPEHEPPVFHTVLANAFLLEGVFYLEEVGKIAICVESDGDIDRLVVMVQDRQLLEEPVAHRSLPDH